MDRWKSRAAAATLIHGVVTILLLVEEILERV